MTLNKLKTSFLHKRQAPQEILEPNEINEEDMEEEPSKSATAKPEPPEVSGSEEEEKQTIVRCEFNEVKLCSRNGAFLIEKPGKGTYIQYSTQNSRVKGEVAKQKL
jgi:hypothetical protein